MTDALAIVRAAIPDATPAVADHVLWGMTCVPFGEVTAQTIYRAASRMRRAESNGIRLCDHCDNRATIDEWTCEPCARALGWKPAQ